MSRPKRTNIAHRLSNWRWSLTSRHLWVDHQTSAYYSFNRHPFQSTFVDGSVAQLQLFVSHFDILKSGGLFTPKLGVRILNPQKYPWIYCFFSDFFGYLLIFWIFFFGFFSIFFLFFRFFFNFLDFVRFFVFYNFFGFKKKKFKFFRFCQIFFIFLLFFRIFFYFFSIFFYFVRFYGFLIIFSDFLFFFYFFGIFWISSDFFRFFWMNNPSFKTLGMHLIYLFLANQMTAIHSLRGQQALLKV